MSDLAQPWLVLLAAGASRRFEQSKALAPWGNSTLLEHMMSIAKSSAPERVAVVTGYNAEDIRPYLYSTFEIFNPNWQQGMGSSIACAIREVQSIDPLVEFIWLLPIDQPLVEPIHLQALFELAKRFKQVAMTQDLQGNIGPPICLPRSFFELAKALQGEKGLKSVLLENDIISLCNQDAFQDADTSEQLKELYLLNPNTFKYSDSRKA